MVREIRSLGLPLATGRAGDIPVVFSGLNPGHNYPRERELY